MKNVVKRCWSRGAARALPPKCEDEATGGTITTLCSTRSQPAISTSEEQAKLAQPSRLRRSSHDAAVSTTTQPSRLSRQCDDAAKEATTYDHDTVVKSGVTGAMGVLSVEPAGETPGLRVQKRRPNHAQRKKAAKLKKKKAK